MGQLIHLPGSLEAPLRASVAIADAAKSRGVHPATALAFVRRDEQRARRETREVPLVLATEETLRVRRARNADDCCAGCGEPMHARMFMQWAQGVEDVFFGHVGCL